MLVHHGDRQRRVSVAAWVRSGLKLGAKILYIEPPDVTAERSFLSVLREHQVAADDVMARGQLEVLAADPAIFCPTWPVRVVDEALANGYPAVHLSAEARTGYDVLSPSAHADIERTVDDLCRTRPMSVLCQYPADLDEASLQAACGLHSHGVRESATQIYPVPGGIAIAGEVDRANEAIIRAALAVATASRHERDRLFVVDLSGLDFIDVGGVRALLTGTSAHRANGGGVRLRGPRRDIERVLRLLGTHLATGIRIERNDG